MEELVLKSIVKVSQMSELTDAERSLVEKAIEATDRSYAPHSHFHVGAALLDKNGKVWTGCNIENASFGLTNCAERTAMFKAVSEGARGFDVIAIAGKTKPWPCGACRQVLNEFAPDIRVIVTWEDHVEEKNLHELLPEGFGPDSM